MVSTDPATDLVKTVASEAKSTVKEGAGRCISFTTLVDHMVTVSTICLNLPALCVIYHDSIS